MASSALAPPQVVDVTLSLFGGSKSDIAPSDCPEGISPDTQDGIYLPGDWQSRPGLAKLYATGALTAGTTVLYSKTYVQPNNEPLTLILTSDGKLWVEDVANTPDVVSSIGSVTPGLYAQSATAFGREYIAFSDLLHGQGIPLQYQGGTTLDRVTQDGPGAPPTVIDLAPTTYAIAAAGIPGLEVTSQTFTIIAASQNGNTVSCTLDTAPGADVQIGDMFLVASVGVAGYNGSFNVTLVAGNIVQCFNGTTGLAPSSGGTLTTYLIVVTTTVATPFQVGNSVVIAGAGVDGYNSLTYTVRIVGSSTVFSIGPVGSSALGHSGGGTISQLGLISPGTHEIVQMFLTRNGALTAPSPAGYWTAAGGMLAAVSDLAIGPANVVARLLGITAAGGADFFTLPASITLPNLPGPPIIIAALVIPDNTSTSFVANFSDNALLDGIAIDQVGNDLFDQRVLGPVLGFFAYASRLMCWGDYEKVENFLNLGFCGGYLSGALTTPLGWTVVNSGGTLVNGGSWAAGMSWQITGDGSGAHKGLIQQTAYQDSFGAAIIQPNTLYGVRLWAKASAATIASAAVITVALANAGVTLNIPCAELTTIGGFIALTLFSGNTIAVIPANALLQLSALNLPNLATVTIGELEIIYGVSPYNNTLVRTSYVLNPEGFAATTGNFGPSDDDSPVRCLVRVRTSGLLETAEGRHTFQDNDLEPSQWVVDQVSQATGALSLQASDTGKFGTGDGAVDWNATASREGIYLFSGGDFWKISQEISRGGLAQSQDPRPTWDDINWAAEQTVVLKNDVINRRLLIAVPLNGALTPNYVAVLDYRELDTVAQIAGSAPVHITLAGKMKSSDLTRKWSWWNISANDMEVLIRPGNQRQLYFAGGSRGGASYGNLYSLDPVKLTDDDYGQISPYYTTYFFTDHDQEQALGLGSDIHFYKRIHAFVAGVGLVTITPIVNSLYNFQPSLSQRLLAADLDPGTMLKSDLEWTNVGIRGQRVAFRIAVQPLPGTTDVQIRLQKFIVAMMKDPVLMTRQSAV